MELHRYDIIKAELDYGSGSISLPELAWIWNIADTPCKFIITYFISNSQVKIWHFC